MVGFSSPSLTDLEYSLYILSSLVSQDFKEIHNMKSGGLSFREICSFLNFLVLWVLCTSGAGAMKLPYPMQEGEVGVLRCPVDAGISPQEVTWKKRLPFTSDETLVTLDVSLGERSGPGYEDGSFNIKKDADSFSLVFTSITSEDGGEFYCIIKNNDEESVSSIWNVQVSRRDMQTQNDPSSPEGEVLKYLIPLIVVSTFAVVGLIILTRVALKRCLDRKFFRRISHYELWKLVKYAEEFREDDKINVVSGIIQPGRNYGSVNEDEDSRYSALCFWKQRCGWFMNQPEHLYKKCEAAEMERSLEELRELRRNLTKVDDATDDNLEHILWEISKDSQKNIPRLFRALGVKTVISIADANPGSKEYVRKALENLKKWKEGSVPINPVVMLSLALEQLKFSEGVNNFFLVPEDEKQQLLFEEVKDFVYSVTNMHCKKLLDFYDGGKRPGINKILRENVTALFNTEKMIIDWLDGQQCSNCDKRKRIREGINKASNMGSKEGNERFTVKAIRDGSSGGKEKEVAYDLLMTDVIPFAKALGLKESKLEEYKIKTFDPSHLTMGTIGLVTVLSK